jgi:hypothetical protein
MKELVFVSSHRLRAPALAMAAIAFCAAAGASSADTSPGAKDRAVATAAPATEEMTLETFLDRLMMAESGGRAFANNPRSTALGPYQFIASTWLQVVNASFADKVAKLKAHEILDLRTEAVFARQVAKAYSQANAAYLVANGFKATFANLRLSFLVGPNGASRILSAKPETPVATLLGPVVINANPFMSRLTAADLIARTERDIAAEPGSQAGIVPSAESIKAVKRRTQTTPQIAVACNLKRPSCRRWLALATRRAARGQRASRD